MSLNFFSDSHALANAKEAAQFLKAKLGDAPKLGIVLGSGLSSFAEVLDDSLSLPTSEIPHAARSTVIGHAGKLVVGLSKKNKVAVMAGRVHGYEGNSPQVVVHNLRSLRLWGVEKFILTNAAGSTTAKLKPGSISLISDQINFTYQNPLIGRELFGGERFPDMSDLYSLAWRKKIRSVARKIKLRLSESVYAGVLGPSFETAAEIKVFNKLGASLVGMSTVWESIALKQMGAEILGISCVTNFGTGVSKQTLSHSEVIERTKKIQKTFNQLMQTIIQVSI